MKKKQVLARVSALLDIQNDLATNGITVKQCCAPESDGRIRCIEVTHEREAKDTRQFVVTDLFGDGWELVD